MSYTTNDSSSPPSAEPILTKYVPPAMRSSWRLKQARGFKEPAISTSPPSLPSPSSSISSSPPSWRRKSDASGSSSSSCSSTSSSPPSSSGSSPSTSKNWRERNDWRARSPRTPSPGDDAKPTYGNLRPGQVLHLPRKECVPSSSVFHTRAARRDDDPWDHPVVILEKITNSTEEMVLCQGMTSLNDGKTFARKSDQSKKRIALCDNGQNVQPHHGTRLLTFEPGSDRFSKPTYVNFYDAENDGQFWIEYRYIQPWMPNGRMKNIIFDQDSLERIKNKQTH